MISEICCTFIVLKYKGIQTTIAMLTDAKLRNYFVWQMISASFFDFQIEKYSVGNSQKRSYHRSGRMLKSEVMLIIILFHCSGYRCMKHFYLEKVCNGIRDMFPNTVSYNRFVELQKEVAVPLAIFIKKVLLGCCTGVSFVDSPVEGVPQPAPPYP